MQQDQATAGLMQHDPAKAGLTLQDQATAALMQHDQATAGQTSQDQAIAGLVQQDQATAGLTLLLLEINKLYIERAREREKERRTCRSAGERGSGSCLLPPWFSGLG